MMLIVLSILEEELNVAECEKVTVILHGL